MIIHQLIEGLHVPKLPDIVEIPSDVSYGLPGIVIDDKQEYRDALERAFSDMSLEDKKR